MSHYTDIGFKLNSPKEVVELFNKIYTNKSYPPKIWNIVSAKNENNILTMQELGEIRYFSKLNQRNDQILEIGLGHNNERVTEMGIIDIDYENRQGFPILQLEKEDIPFWFECPNVETFNMKNKNECKVKIASFANSVKVKCPKEQDIVGESEFSLADEAYIADWDNDPSTALVSGIIKGYIVERNVITNNNYYAIDVDCLGLNIKMLVDIDLIEETNIIVGHIIFGKFWNTAIIIDEN